MGADGRLELSGPLAYSWVSLFNKLFRKRCLLRTPSGVWGWLASFVDHFHIEFDDVIGEFPPLLPIQESDVSMSQF